VFFRVKRSSCRSIMLRQEELAFIKAISTLLPSPTIPQELRMALSRRRKMPALPAGSRRTAPGGGSGAHQRTTGQLVCKRKSNELAGSGDSFELANRRPAPSQGHSRLCRECTGSHGRTSYILQPATRSTRGWVEVRVYLSWVRRPV